MASKLNIGDIVEQTISAGVGHSRDFVAGSVTFCIGRVTETNPNKMEMLTLQVHSYLGNPTDLTGLLSNSTATPVYQRGVPVPVAAQRTENEATFDALMGFHELGYLTLVQKGEKGPEKALKKAIDVLYRALGIEKPRTLIKAVEELGKTHSSALREKIGELKASNQDLYRQALASTYFLSIALKGMQE